MFSRREFLGLALVTFIPVSEPTMRAGDILLTRNAGGDATNQSPGYYNHAAILGPLNWVIESQATPNSIIAVPIWYFMERYPEVLVLRNNNQSIAQKTAGIATKYIGRTYDKIMSIRPFYLWKESDSCVSLVKRIYNQATGTTYRWWIPDDFAKTPWLSQIALKRDYENYVPPQSYYLGMQKTWVNRPAEEFYNQDSGM